MVIDVVIVVAYFAMMIVCGIVAMRRLKSTADYLVADRNLPFWVFFPCLSAVILGGGSTFGSASQSYQFGLSGAWITFMFGLGVVFIGLFLAGRIAKLDVFTLSELLQRRYGHGSGYVSAIVSTIYTVLIAVVQIIALGTILKELLGWSLNAGILAGGMVTVIYTMIGGMIASSMGAGFIGGIAAGFIAGYGVAFMAAHIRLPQALKGLLPMLILPVLGSLFTGLLMFYLVGAPVAELLQWLSAWLRGMQGASALLLGLLLGAMMAFDMGGPVNKAAYAFSTGMIASQVYTPMAAAMIAGMTPPLGLALATRLFADRFTREERGSAASAGVLGLAFVTEGAIPYAARDPLRTIPALVLGSAVAGAVSMLAGVELKVPHGGIFVAPIPNAVTHVAMYAVALVAGVVVTAIALRMFKRPAEAGL